MASLKETIYLHNLIAIAYSDGEICEREIHYLKKKAFELGFKAADLERMIRHASEFQLVPPLNYFDKIRYINDCVEMAMADGAFSIKELELCKKVCAKMGLDEIHLQEAITLRKSLVSQPHS